MDDYLRILVDSYESAQKQRINYGNRLFSIKSGVNPSTPEEETFVEEMYNDCTDQEERILKRIKKYAAKIPIIEAAEKVKGVGLLSIARIVCHIDIDRCQYVSSLWRYCGYGVDENGVADRPKKGEKLKYNKRAKVACYVLSTSFLRVGSPYRKIYDETKAYYEAERPSWTKLHIHNASLRKMVKVFLSHLFYVWKNLEGCTPDSPYVIDMLGHKHYMLPQDYGWETE